MSENGKPKPEKDKLAEVVQKKQVELEIDGRKIIVKKWGLLQSLTLSAKLAKVVGDVIKQLPVVKEDVKGEKKEKKSLEFKVASLLQIDIADVLERNFEDIVLILAKTIAKENFQDVDEAQVWIKELDAGGAVEIFAVIAKQNIRPLLKAVGKLAKSLGVSVEDLKASQPST